MKTAFCVDVSGSMSSDGIQQAYNYIHRFFKREDVTIAFDVKATIVCYEIFNGKEDSIRKFGGGGTYAPCAIKLANEEGCNRLVLLSDGCMPPEDFNKFDIFIDVCKSPEED
jgi:predicted metal-dependent peptidase